MMIWELACKACFGLFRVSALPAVRRWRGELNWQVVPCEMLEARSLPSAVSFVIDYTYDTNDFFDTQEKRDLLQEVADLFSEKLTDNLAAITPGGGNSWKAEFTNPATGKTGKTSNLSVPEDTLIVYAGGRSLSGSTLAIGGPGGWSALGSNSWFDIVDHRGQSGAAGTSPTDFGPWGGSITFDTVGTDWFFGSTTAGLGSNESDFVSVAMHELGHLLGFGTADSFDQLVSGGTFTGPKSVAAYDGIGNPPLDTDNSHWDNGVRDEGAEVAMDPVITDGERKLFTDLDWAALDDLGWSLTPLTPVEPPAISLPGSAPTYVRGGARITLDSEATFDNPSFLGLMGSQLLVTGGANVGKFDTVTIANGNGLTKVGSKIKFNGVVIGTITNGVGVKPLKLTFNAKATDEAVKACLQSLQFYTSSKKAGTLDRTLSIQLVKAEGEDSASVTKVVHVK